MKSKLKLGLGVGISALLLAIIIVLSSLSAYFYDAITPWWSGTFTKADVTVDYTAKQARNNAEAVTEEVAGEGLVLLENRNAALPLKETERSVALIGFASHSPVYCGAGSVSWSNPGDRSDFYDAFEYYGFTVNETMRDYYGENFGGREDKSDSQNMSGGDYTIYDPPVAQYKDKLAKAAKESDVAVVTVARAGGEGGDVPLDMGKESYKNGNAGKHYLQLQQSEIDMIKECKTAFKKVIVLINSSNAMELGELDTIGVDAVVWIGMPGGTGTYSVVGALTGEINPSGRMADTYAYDIKTSPSYWASTAATYANYDEFAKVTVNGFEYDNKVDGGAIWYYEGIYVGYRWYETADADGYFADVDNVYGKGYEGVVQYPFGYGQSYTDFSWKVTGKDLGGMGGKIKVSVEVQNTGATAGKDVVQLYYTAPYTDYDKSNGVEKAHKVLGAFAKTSLLEPKEKETVTLEMDADDLASYDSNGKKCYIAEKGTYYLNLQTDSHNVKKDVAAIEYKIDSDRVYNADGVGKRSSDQTVAENRFDIVTKGDGNIGTNAHPYLTRKDFKGTFPSVHLGEKHITEQTWSMGADTVEYMKNSLGGSDVKFEDDAKLKTDLKVRHDEDNGLTAADLAGYGFDDEKWWDLIAQMSVEDMVNLMADSGYGTAEIKSIGLNATDNADGPSGIGSLNSNKAGNQYTSEPVMASTWNTDLMYRVGQAVGMEGMVVGLAGWYAPGLNTHRSPFGGRAGEYFSEDGLLAGKIGAAEVKGVQDEGVYVYAKHFALNDQDQKRGGMYTWANEQSIREVYLKPFEYAVKEGGALGLMASYNRIGPMESSCCRALNVEVTRNEWGFKGSILTDGFSHDIGSDKYNNPDVQIRAGAGQLLWIPSSPYSYASSGYTSATLDSDYGMQCLMESCRRMVYRHVNSAAIGITLDRTPYWLIIVVAVDVLCLAGVVLLTIFMIVPFFRKKKIST